MFKWLTRNDGARLARARRRLGSPRGSVFSEFAIMVPVVVLVCSALIEIVGFWDAQVMANHAAWTVGRIAMVRGSNGLAFSKSLDEKSKTGIPNTDMPDAIKNLINDINKGIAGANKFNDRANIATLFLMSTCGIGYYGSSPGQTLSDGFNKLVDDGVKALTDGVPEWITEAVKDIVIPSFIGGNEDGIAGFVNNIVKTIVDKIAEVALKPIADALGKLLRKAFDDILGKDGVKIDKLFNGKSAAARYARQVYGAGSRIVRAKSTIGKEVVTVTDMDGMQGGFLFARDSNLKRLVYPEVVDKETTSDGYFVTGVHGWPANADGLAMVHVEINWPYEYGWLFPVVSGGAAVSKPPVATGHSMVFPQPEIGNENLYSEGATAFNPGSYTNAAALKGLDDLAKEMKDYLKYVKFGMKFRICDESLSFTDGKYRAATATWWKYCPQLRDLWPFDPENGDSYPVRGNYGYCWAALTDNSSQSTKENTLNDKGYFNGSSYHNRDYYYWDGAYHKSYRQSLCSTLGNSGLGSWYEKSQGLTYADSSTDAYSSSYQKFYAACKKCVVSPKLTQEEKAWLKNKIARLLRSESMVGIVLSYDGMADMYKKVSAFARRNKVNVHNVVKWIEGHDLEAWKTQDEAVKNAAQAADRSFKAIRDLLRKEIRDIENMENGTSTWTGNDDDPVFDPNDEEVMQNPEAAAEKARKKWNTMKKDLRKKLREIDGAAEALRSQWSQYKQAPASFEAERKKCVAEYFDEVCVCLLAKTGGNMFREEQDAGFVIPAGLFPYDIGKGTREMLDKIKAYQNKVNASYKLEVEYGAMLGLKSAGEAKREGKTPDEVVDPADGVGDDTPGSLAPGSDKNVIIDKDHQTYQGGAWKWN